MKILIPPEKAELFSSLPREKPPFSELAATQTFKLIGWATATAGVYLLQERSGSFGLYIIPYLLMLVIIWDITAKLKWEPAVQREQNELYVILTWKYAIQLFSACLFSFFTAWAVVFWLAPLINTHILSAN
ncbi:MAG: hypothetical protein HUJ23_08120 [Methylophaga sp.]|nr:hypothetical protein [Methylophaga sp.]